MTTPTQNLDPQRPGPGQRKVAAGIAIALLAIAALAIVLVVTRRDRDEDTYVPAAKPADSLGAANNPGVGTLPAGDPGVVTPTERPLLSTGADQPTNANPSGEQRAAAAATGEMKASAGAAVVAPRGPETQKASETYPARRISDPAVILLTRQQLQLMRHYELGKTDVKVKVCLDTNGVPNDVKVVSSSGVEEIDKRTVDTIRTWNYLPQISDGHLVASCTDVKVNFQLAE